MSLRTVNIFAILASVIVALTFEFGALAAHNAFFAALAIVALYTGYQLVLREGAPLLATLKAVLTNPDAYPRKAAYYAYISCVAVGLLVASQAVVAAA